MIAKIRKALRILQPYYTITPVERALRAAYDEPAHTQDAGAPIVALQCSEDLLYFGTFAEIIRGLRKILPVTADQYVFRSLRHGENSSFIGWVITRLSVNPISDRRWVHLYSSFCDAVAARSARWLSPAMEWKIWRQARAIQRDYQSKEAFARLEIRGIRIGDLVIDSFIRFAPSPEFDIRHPYTLRVLRQALRDLQKAFAYFGSRKPNMFLTSYTSYVQHGVPARVAIAHGVRVIGFGNYQQIWKTLSAEDDTHLAEHWRYAERFAALPPAEQERLKMAADRLLAARMRGEIDSAIGYMATSAYEAKTTGLPPVQNAVIVYLPDFYDSVHVYRWTLFEDFWDWVCFTIDTLDQAGIEFFIKGHPNASEESLKVYDRVRARYPHAGFLAPGITSAQLADAGIACGVSPRGTVLSELPYLGVPIIAGGDHPHVAFDLEPPPMTVEAYRQKLLEARSLPRDPALTRARACAFYAMHNLFGDPQALASRNKWLDLRGMTYHFLPDDAAKTVSGFEELGHEPDFHRQVAAWAAELSGNSAPGKLANQQEFSKAS